MLRSLRLRNESVIPKWVSTIEIMAQNGDSLVPLGSNGDKSDDHCPKDKQKQNKHSNPHGKPDFAIHSVAHFESCGDDRNPILCSKRCSQVIFDDRRDRFVIAFELSKLR